jgi:GT2 family glycosyltransferase
MAPSVSIVIPTWNGLDLLKQFLQSVIKAASYYSGQSHARTEIIIVDDGSTDRTIEWLTAQGFTECVPEAGKSARGGGVKSGRGDETKRATENDEVVPQPFTLLPSSTFPPSLPPGPIFRFIRNETNRGFGESCNRGFEAAISRLVLLVNNDVDLAEDAIGPLVENFKDSSLFAAHCRVFDLESNHECGTGKLGGFSRGFIRVHRSYSRLNEKRISEIVDKREGDAALYSMFAGGGSAMFDRERFQSIGGFEPLLSPFYWEDVELSYRAWKRGYCVAYEPRSVARHRISSTIGKLDRRGVKIIQQRNRLIYHWIHLHDKRLLATHILWVVLLALTAPVRLQPGFLSSLTGALKSLGKVLARRREEKSCARRSDRDVFEIFSKLEARADLFVYDDTKALQLMMQAEEKREGKLEIKPR